MAGLDAEDTRQALKEFQRAHRTLSKISRGSAKSLSTENGRMGAGGLLQYPGEDFYPESDTRLTIRDGEYPQVESTGSDRTGCEVGETGLLRLGPLDLASEQCPSKMREHDALEEEDIGPYFSNSNVTQIMETHLQQPLKSSSSRTSAHTATPRGLRKVRSTAPEYYDKARSRVRQKKSQWSAISEPTSEVDFSSDDISERKVGAEFSASDSEDETDSSELLESRFETEQGVQGDSLGRPLSKFETESGDSSDSPPTNRVARAITRLTRRRSRRTESKLLAQTGKPSRTNLIGDGVGGGGIVVYPPDDHSATVIFLHGFGDKPSTWTTSFKSFGLRHVKYVLPTAPYLVSKAALGVPARAWFSIERRKGNNALNCNESELKMSLDRLNEIILREMSSGIPPRRILVGGFSQGAALALSILLAGNSIPLGGIFALSGWLPLPELETDAAKVSDERSEVPILLVCGNRDKVVPEKRTKCSKSELAKLGFKDIRLHSIDNVAHDVNDQILSLVNIFISKQVPLKFSHTDQPSRDVVSRSVTSPIF